MVVIHPMGDMGHVISSGYGPRWGTLHAGTDYPAAVGTPIYAPADGVVVQGQDRKRGSVSGFGSWIWIDCQSSVGRDFIFGHVHHPGILVRAGDRVTAGQQIGVVGNEGQSTGPHLHFEVWGAPGRSGGKSEDPAGWLRARGAVSRGAATPSTTPAPTPGVAVARSGEYKADADKLTYRDSGVSKQKRFWVCIHTDESAWDQSTRSIRPTAWTADRLAEYNRDRSNSGGSYHIGVDRSGRAVRQNSDPYATWSTGNAANFNAFHICATGTAHQSREQWLAHMPQLRKMADITAHYCAVHGIPVRRITPADLKAGRGGIGGHWDATHAYSGGSGHWDPGGYAAPYAVTQGGFPWDQFITLVSEASTTQTIQETIMTTLDTVRKSAVEGSTVQAELWKFIMLTDAHTYELHKALIADGAVGKLIAQAAEVPKLKTEIAGLKKTLQENNRVLKQLVILIEKAGQ